MKRRISLAFLILSFFLGEIPVQAWDPASLTGAITTALESFNFMKKLFGLASQASGLLDELEGLGDELGMSSQTLQELQEMVDQVREIERLAQEIGYEQEALQELQEDFRSTESLTGLVGRTTEFIRTWKRQRSKLREAMGSDPLEKVKEQQIKSNQLLEQQLQAQLELLKAKEQKKLLKWKARFQEKKRQKEQVQTWRKELSDQGVKEDPQTKLLSFPSGKVALKKAIQASEALKQKVFLVLGFAFLVRLVASLLGAGTPFEVLKHLVSSVAWLLVYPFFLETWTEIGLGLGEALGVSSFQPLRPENFKPESFPQATFLFWKIPAFVGAFVWEQLRFGFLSVVKLLFEGGLQLATLLFPLVVLISFLVQASGAVKLWAFLGVWLGCWPVIWAAIGRLAQELQWVSAEGFFQSLFYLLIQVLFPLLGFSWLKNPLTLSSGAARVTARAVHSVAHRFRGGKT